jgi:hypothetical protein
MIDKSIPLHPKSSLCDNFWHINGGHLMAKIPLIKRQSPI